MQTHYADSTRIASMKARKEPEAKDMIAEVQQAVRNADGIGAFSKLELCHETRRCLWDNQTDDGLKYGEDAFPYEGSVDTRHRLAEKYVADNVRLRMSAIRSGSVQIGPQEAVDDAYKAALWNRVLKFYVNHKKRHIRKELKLFFNCVEEFGYGIVHVDWRDVMRLLPQKVTEEQLITLVAGEMIQAQTGGDDAQRTPEMEEAAAQEAAMQVMEALMAEDETRAMDLLLRHDAAIPTSEARRAVRQLRKNQVAEYLAPRSLGGMPKLRALIPWVNVVHGIELRDSDEIPWMAIPESITEYEFEEQALIQNWNEAAVTEAKKHPNQRLTDMESLIASHDWLLNGWGLGLRQDTTATERVNMYQVITVYRMAMTEMGVPAVFKTTVSPSCPDMLLGHEVEKCGVMPFVVEAREPGGLLAQSRGVAELVFTDQIAQKKLKDATTAAAEIEGFPPTVQMGSELTKVRPGAVFQMGRNSGSPGTQSRFLDVPGVGQGTLKAMEMFKADTDELFHRGPNADPELKRAMLEDMGMSAVEAYEDIIRIVWKQIQVYVETFTASRIAGRPVDVTATAEDLHGEADISVEFSALSLNQEAAGELAEFLTKMAPLDRAGRYDWGSAVETVTRTFDPSLAERIVLDSETAASQIDEQMRGDLAVLASGQMPAVRKGAEQRRLQIMQEWMQNPSVQQQLTTDPVLAQRTQTLWEAYTFQVTQNQNAIIGSIGYDPSKDPVLGDEAQAQSQGGIPAMTGGMAA